MATANPLPDPVSEALARPFVKRLPAERRARLEADLRASWAEVGEGASLAVFQKAVEERLRAEQGAPPHVEPDELDELNRRAADAVAHPEGGIPVERFFAARGIRWPPLSAG